MPIRGVTSRNLLMPINQMDGVQQDIPRTLAHMPAATVEDYQNLVSRLEGASVLIDQTVALMERGLAAGMTPPPLRMRDVPIRSPGRLSPIRWTARCSRRLRRLAGVNPRPRRAALTAKRPPPTPSDWLRRSRLHDFLTSRYLPACRRRRVRPRSRTARRYTPSTSNGIDDRQDPEGDPRDGSRGGQTYPGRDGCGHRSDPASREATASSATFLRTAPKFFYTDAAHC